MASQSTSDLIRRSLEALELRGQHHPEDALERLTGLVDLLSEWSTQINLTGHRSPTAIVEGILGRALGLSTILAAEGAIVDLGSGAGFPGLPLAILRPGVRVTLVESRARRHHFQLHAVRSLGLANAYPVLGRAEELEASLHDVAVAQAVGPPQEVILLALPWLRPGGRVVVSGLSETPATPRGISAAELRSYQLPLSADEIPVWMGTRSLD
jgi:16S rRNA (guanine527-N7)-methyltransferase